MHRPGFGATTLILIVLTIIGLVAVAIKPLIPPGPPNALSGESSYYLQQGAHQRIAWRTISPDLAAAAGGGKPIMLVIGTPWSRIARMFDEGVFAEPFIQAFVSHTFVCVRIDGSDNPEWLSAYWRLGRVQDGMIPDFQIWFLDSQGHPYDSVHFGSVGDVPDYDAFHDRLDKLRDEAEDAPAIVATAEARDLASDLDDVVKSKASAVLGPADCDQFFDVCAGVAGADRRRPSKYGGFPNRAPDSAPVQRLLPNALLYLLLTGADARNVETYYSKVAVPRRPYAAFHEAADPAMGGPIVDWLDGGFFIRSESIDWSRPEFDKTAIQNAELMQVFALADVLLKHAPDDPPYKQIAMAAFDALAGPFMSDGYVQACRVGDEVKGGRSAHSSFAPSLLRDLLGGLSVRTSSGASVDAYPWARSNLGLRVESNPEMLVSMPDPRLTLGEPQALASVLAALRASADERPVAYAAPAVAEVNGTVAARMLWVARLWNDPERLAKAHALFQRLGSFFVGDFVVHSLHRRNGADYLGDYLAYADAALQDYLATGSAKSFQSGLDVLTKARELFETRGQEGVWNVVHNDPKNSPLDSLEGMRSVGGPQLADDEGESCTARLIRLANSYGMMLHGGTTSEKSLATSLQMDAFYATTAFAGAATLWNNRKVIPAAVPVLAGYYCAAAPVVDERYAEHAFVVGPHCLQIAGDLLRLAPTHMVASCLGPVRRDLQRLGPGIYVMGRDERPRGPLTLGEAAAALQGQLHPRAEGPRR